jgi:histidinol-phosphatase (PHP family)
VGRNVPDRAWPGKGLPVLLHAQAKLTPETLRSSFDAYVHEARSLQRQYEGKLHILVGMETEHTGKHSLDFANDLRAQYGLDYIVGSVHHVNGCAEA